MICDWDLKVTRVVITRLMVNLQAQFMNRLTRRGIQSIPTKQQMVIQLTLIQLLVTKVTGQTPT